MDAHVCSVFLQGIPCAMELVPTNASTPPTASSHSVYNNFTQFTTEQYAAFLVCGNIQTLVSTVGIVGNSLNIIVMMGAVRKRDHSPIYHLLLAMGVADLISLLFSTIYTLTMFTSWPPLLWQVSAGC